MASPMRAVILVMLVPFAVGATEEVQASEPANPPNIEVGIFPVSAKLNTDSTTQYAAGGLASWELRPGFALQTRFTHQYYVTLSGLAQELAMSHRTDDQLSADPWHQWSLLAGTELSPFQGEGVYAGTPVGLSAGVGGLLGVVATRHAWLDSNRQFLPTSGFDTGLHPAAGFSLGLRVQIGRHFAVRGELTSVLSSRGVTTVSGCTVQDLAEMDEQVRSANSLQSAQVSSGCDLDAFEGGRLVPLAYNTARGSVANPLIHTLSAQIGAAVVF